MLLDRIAATISRYSMMAPGARIGVGVSGGADSVCLLHALHRMGWEVQVLHVNHGLRGVESEGDERFVAELAAELGVGFAAWAGRPGGGNVEAAAREVRLAVFRAARAELGLGAVATGHTRTDQAETVLFRAMRGSGPGGLAGILPVTGDGVVRPLLEVSREEVRAYLEGEGLAWREDSSNGESRYARNRLRREVLPVMEAILPQTERSLARLAGIAAGEEEYWRAEVERVWRPVEERTGEVVLEVSGLAALAPALGRRVVRRALEEALGRCSGVSMEQVDGVMEVALRREGWGRVSLAGGEAWRSFGLLRVAGERRGDGERWRRRLEGAGRVETPGATVEVEESAYNEGSDRIDAGVARLPWLVRGWQAGDAYQPIGAGRPVSLKEMFQRARIPCWDRRDWPMVVCEDRIVWSKRFGVAAWAAAGPESRRVVDVRVRDE